MPKGETGREKERKPKEMWAHVLDWLIYRIHNNMYKVGIEPHADRRLA